MVYFAKFCKILLLFCKILMDFAKFCCYFAKFWKMNLQNFDVVSKFWLNLQNFAKYNQNFANFIKILQNNIHVWVIYVWVYMMTVRYFFSNYYHTLFVYKPYIAVQMYLECKVLHSSSHSNFFAIAVCSLVF